MELSAGRTNRFDSTRNTLADSTKTTEFGLATRFARLLVMLSLAQFSFNSTSFEQFLESTQCGTNRLAVVYTHTQRHLLTSFASKTEPAGTSGRLSHLDDYTKFLVPTTAAATTTAATTTVAAAATTTAATTTAVATTATAATTAAATTITATTATAAATTTATTAATRTGAIFAGLGFVHGQVTTHEFDAVRRFDGLFRTATHFDECEATAAARVAVRHDLSAGHATVLAEELQEVVRSRLERKVPNIQFHRSINFPGHLDPRETESRTEALLPDDY